MLSALKAANGSLNGAAIVCPSSPASGDRGERTSLRLEPWLTRLAAMTILLSTFLGQWLWAGDSWGKKPYSEWTESEALKVLQDSAWSKLSYILVNSDVVVNEPQSRSTAGEARTEEQSNCCRTFTRIVDGASAESSPGDTTSPGRTVPMRQVHYYRVLLYSSAHIRQALVRLSQIRGGIWDTQAAASVEKPLEDLVIAVAGSNMQPFENAAGQALIGSTYLRSKKWNKEKVELKDFVPSGIRQDGLALFVFSREVDGKPAFSATDDLIEFGTGEGAFKIRASFKLEKMVVNGVPDF